jgi:hypothetical protein
VHPAHAFALSLPEAVGAGSALALLPGYLGARTNVIRVRDVEIP